MLNQAQVDKVNSNLSNGVASLANQDWTGAEQSFLAAERILADNFDEQYLHFSLRQIVILLNMIAKLKLNKTKEVVALYLEHIGIVGTLRDVDASRYSSLVPSGQGFNGVRRRLFMMKLPGLLVGTLQRLKDQGHTIKLRDGSEKYISYTWLDVSAFLEHQKIINDLYRSFLLIFLWKSNKEYKLQNDVFLNNCNYKTLGIPSILEVAVMSNDVYQNDTTTAKSTFSGCPNKSATDHHNLAMQDWKLFKYSPVVNPDYFFAKAYVNEKKKLLVIACRGTRGLNYNDWTRANAFLIQGKMPKLYFDSAIQFYEDVLKQLTVEQRNNYLIYFTGHSLGGAIAELLSCKYNIPAITFDSPGVKEILIWQHDNDIRLKRQLTFNSPHVDIHDNATIPVLGILTQPNLVNVCNKHVGRTFAIPKNWFKPLKMDLNPFSVGWSLVLSKFKQGAVDIMPGDLTRALIKVCETLQTHELPLTIEYFAASHQADQFLKTVISWPSSYAASEEEELIFEGGHYYRMIALGNLPKVIRPLIEYSSENSANQQITREVRDLLSNLRLSDIRGAHSTFKDGPDRAIFVLSKGKILPDEIRLLMWHYAYHSRFASLRMAIRREAPKQPDSLTVMQSNLSAVDMTTGHSQGSRACFFIAFGVGIGTGLGFNALSRHYDITLDGCINRLFLEISGPSGTFLGWNPVKTIVYGVIDSLLARASAKIVSSYALSSREKQAGIVASSAVLTYAARKTLICLLNSRVNNSFSSAEFLTSVSLQALGELWKVIARDMPARSRKEELVDNTVSAIVAFSDTVVPQTGPYSDDDYEQYLMLNSGDGYKKYLKRLPSSKRIILQQMQQEMGDHFWLRVLSRFGTSLVIQPATNYGLAVMRKQLKWLEKNDLFSPCFAGITIGLLSVNVCFYFIKK